ncbi:16S rRNA G1207 methylase RsmC [Streptomyces sp. V4I8]
MPRRFGTALDVGCGAGELARLLAVRAEEGVVAPGGTLVVVGPARDAGHGADQDPGEFIKWIAKVTGYRRKVR